MIDVIQGLLRNKLADDIGTKPVIDTFYAILNALDSKANGLLRINSLFISILLAAGSALKTIGKLPPNYIQWFAVLSFVSLVTSCAFCLSIMRIKWRFLGKARRLPDGGYDFTAELNALSQVVSDRTTHYNAAWWLTIAGLLLFLLAFVPTIIL